MYSIYKYIYNKIYYIIYNIIYTLTQHYHGSVSRTEWPICGNLFKKVVINVGLSVVRGKSRDTYWASSLSNPSRESNIIMYEKWHIEAQPRWEKFISVTLVRSIMSKAVLTLIPKFLWMPKTRVFRVKTPVQLVVRVDYNCTSSSTVKLLI